MCYYVYKVTNNLNGKFYIGKRKHSNPTMDSYMGSGKLIKQAIQKYGVNNFTKEIIEIFNTDEDAAKLEKTLVSKEVVSSNQSYNMHEGGFGGFSHINNVPPHERVNILELQRKIKSGEITVGGTKHWSDESKQKVVRQGIKNIKEGNIGALANTTEAKEKRRQTFKTKKIGFGESNSSYGTHIYIDSSYVGKTPDTSVLNKNRFKPGEEPVGWILVSIWKDNKKKKSGAYGKRWFNDGNCNFFLSIDDERIKTLNKGRLHQFLTNSPRNR